MKTIIRSNGRPLSIKDNNHRFFYPDEYMKVFDIAKTRLKHSLKCLINTGARINEIRNVQVQDIDFDNRRMVLKVTKTKAVKGETKGRMRTIPISSQFRNYLKTYSKDLQGKDYLSVLSTPAFDIAIKKACKLSQIADYSNFSAHTLRKTIETWLMALGMQDMAITAHLGHDIRTAASHYVSPDVFTFEEKKKIRLIIGDLYER